MADLTSAEPDDFDGCGSAVRLSLAQALDSIFEYGCSAEQLAQVEQAFRAHGWVLSSDEGQS